MQSPSPNLEWWPERQLRQHPLRRIVVCGQRLHPPLLSHVVNFPRLEIPLHGRYENQIDEEGRLITVQLQPGTALFAAPNCWNLPLWRRDVKLMSLIFGRKQLGISLVNVRSPGVLQLTAKKYSAPWPLNGPLPLILEAMVELQATGGPSAVFINLANSLVCCVPKLFEQPTPGAANRAQRLLDSVCIYLQNHYQYEITRDSVAAEFGVTPNHLSRLFQTHGYMTFSSYLTHVRIDRAKHLLKSYNLTLDDVAARCGYRDTPYFCRVFKRFTKVTPAEYRQSIRRTQVAAG